MRNKKGSAKTWGRTAWLAGGLAVAVTGALVVGLTSPAAADPQTTYVAAGSDTTQDVMDGFAASVGGGLLGSWDAVNPVTAVAHEQIAPKPGCTMTRPNGSGEGLAALRKSINQNTTATQLADPPEAGCVDFSRSSGAPATADASTTGALIYVPFALDAVAPATGPATAVGGSDPAVATAIVNADLFTKANLQAMYSTCTAQTVNGVTYTPDGTVTDATNQPIHLYIPQPGSGTRSFWATQMGFTNGSPPACVHDHSEVTNALIEEHNGLVVAGDADGITPFSIAQFISQQNGHNDRRHNAVIHSLNGIAPRTGGQTGTLNTAYPITREVYNVVPFAKVTPGAGQDATLTALLAGSSSKLCGLSLLIHSFGFATLETAPLGHTCGALDPALRAFDPTTDPV
jgi:ABC-type phosphate transport system substrate-binding protein